MTCYHEIFHLTNYDQHSTLVNSENFDAQLNSNSYLDQMNDALDTGDLFAKTDFQDHVPPSNEIHQVKKYCDEELLEFLEDNYGSIELQ
jgi:hypothetical protein